MNLTRLIPLLTVMVAVTPLAGAIDAAARQRVADKVASEYPSLEVLYRDLHTHPELCLLEERTAGVVARELRAAGCEVTEKVGGVGVVGVMKNGAGPTLLIRSDMDALPVQEETGVAYASTAHMKDVAGQLVPVMHACGHDIHMTVLTGTARVMHATMDRWSG